MGILNRIDYIFQWFLSSVLAGSWNKEHLPFTGLSHISHYSFTGAIKRVAIPAILGLFTWNYVNGELLDAPWIICHISSTLAPLIAILHIHSMMSFHCILSEVRIMSTFLVFGLNSYFGVTFTTASLNTACVIYLSLYVANLLVLNYPLSYMTRAMKVLNRKALRPFAKFAVFSYVSNPLYTLLCLELSSKYTHVPIVLTLRRIVILEKISLVFRENKGWSIFLFTLLDRASVYFPATTIVFLFNLCFLAFKLGPYVNKFRNSPSMNLLCSLIPTTPSSSIQVPSMSASLSDAGIRLSAFQMPENAQPRPDLTRMNVSSLPKIKDILDVDVDVDVDEEEEEEEEINTDQYLVDPNRCKVLCSYEPDDADEDDWGNWNELNRDDDFVIYNTDNKEECDSPTHPEIGISKVKAA